MGNHIHQQETGHDDGQRCDNDQRQQPRGRACPAPRRIQCADGKLADIVAKIDDHRAQRADMQGDIESQFVGPAALRHRQAQRRESVAHEYQMRR